MILKSIIEFYKVSKPKPCGDGWTPESERRLKHLQWSTFLSATLGYGMYYVCRLSLNVVKKPIVEEGIFSETELGIIGSGAVLHLCNREVYQRIFGGQKQYQAFYVDRSVGDSTCESVFGLYPFVHPVCCALGNQRMVSVDGSCFVRGGFVALV